MIRWKRKPQSDNDKSDQRSEIGGGTASEQWIDVQGNESGVECQGVEPKEPDPRDSEPLPVSLATLFHLGSRPPKYEPEPVVPPLPMSHMAGRLIHDSVVDGFIAGRFAVRAASVRGDRHRHLGSPRQDAMTAALLGTVERGVVLGVVADGVGSAELSHHGATVACATVVAALLEEASTLEAALSTGDKDSLFYHAVHVVDEVASEIEIEAQRLGSDPAALSTTLRVVLLPTGVSPWRVAFSVGDGETYRLIDGKWSAIGRRRESSDAVIHTTAVDALPGCASRMRFGMWEAVPGEIAVTCTDGLSQPLKDPDFSDYLAKEWSTGELPGTLRFMWQMQSRLRTYDDDRAVICVWDRDPSSPQE